jgi:ATP-dependent Lhr-like helicase
MIQAGYLHLDEGCVGIGPEAERQWGGRNYMEVLSVFDTPDLFTVMFGNRNLGSVHELSFRRRDGSAAVLLLGGRPWRVESIDTSRRIAWVEPAEELGRSTWLGTSVGLSFEICQAMRAVLLDAADSANWSRRARESLAKTRAEADVDKDGTVLRTANAGCEWWTWAGLRGNAALSLQLAEAGIDATFDSTAIRARCSPAQLGKGLKRPTEPKSPSPDSRALPKFSACVPDSLLGLFARHRLFDWWAANRIRERYPCVMSATQQ